MALNLKRPRGSKRNRPLLSTAGRAGPRRLLVLATAAVSVFGLGAFAMTRSMEAPPLSAAARMTGIDWLPAGLLTSPTQEALAVVAGTEAGDAALREGRSTTPRFAASVRLVDGKPAPEPDAPPPARRPSPPPRPFVNTQPPPPVYPAPVVIPAVAHIVTPPNDPPEAPKPQPTPVQYQAAPRNDAQQRAYDQQMRDLLDQWASRPPHTDVILPPDGRGDGNAPASPAAAPRTPELPGIQPVLDRQEGGRILVPAGRGIYAHPILKLSSDTGGPVVLQADSGLIAGDRLIGSFSQQGNRLVIKIDNVIHRGEPIGAAGFVVAPGTMEAGVASDVDQNYASRFLLPAAAAFVQGLGGAIATTSNTAAVLSPLGGVTTSTNLNLSQQLGIAAGVAASNVGSTLNAAAPRGPTVTLDAGVTVGVMFLSNVVSRAGR